MIFVFIILIGIVVLGISILLLLILLNTDKNNTYNLTTDQIVDRDYLIKLPRNYSNLLTRLDKTSKGTALIANKDIKKGDLICYYKMKVFNSKDYKGVKGNIYTFNVYNKNNKHFEHLVGDIYEGSIEKSINGVTFWGHLANEPNIDQTHNSQIITSSNKNIQADIKEGDIIIYELVAKNDIKKDDEITWCYGSYYKRNYIVSEDCKNN